MSGLVTRKDHWETVYQKKSPLEVSWYQKTPTLSLQVIQKHLHDHSLPIIDVGGGASVLVDHLLQKGYSGITVLDISGEALTHAKKRLGEKSESVSWVESDITVYAPGEIFTLWHDRAVFHFLTEKADRKKYVEVLEKATRPGSYVMIAAFSVGGPEKCSGLDIVQYDKEKLQAELGGHFSFLEEHFETHITPAGKEQAFGYFVFVRK